MRFRAGIERFSGFIVTLGCTLALRLNQMASTPNMPTEQVEVVIQPRSGWIPVDWRELWEHRELLGFLVQRDIKVRYKQTVLGVAWAILQPVLTVTIFWIVFGGFAKMPSDGIPYPVFAFVGMLPWMLFSTAVVSGGQSLINQQQLLTKVYLPRLLIPASCIGAALVDFSIGLLVLLAVMGFYGLVPGVGVLALPLLALMTAFAALGAALYLAALTVAYRDFRFVIPFLMQVWMYVSPVIYPMSLVPEKYRTLFALNPMVGAIDGFRSALLGTPWDLSALSISAAVSTMMLLFGAYYFRRTERTFADLA